MPNENAIKNALGLLNSMVICGESHTDRCRQDVQSAYKELHALLSLRSENERLRLAVQTSFNYLGLIQANVDNGYTQNIGLTPTDMLNWRKVLDQALNFATPPEGKE